MSNKIGDIVKAIVMILFPNQVHFYCAGYEQNGISVSLVNW